MSMYVYGMFIGVYMPAGLYVYEGVYVCVYFYVSACECMSMSMRVWACKSRGVH